MARSTRAIASARTHPAPVYPGLNRAFGLAAIEDASERGFLVTKLVRQANRYREELRRAASIADSYVR
jgi:hypothetical protein